MSHKWWHFLGGSPEEKKLEELRAEEARILKSNEKYGEGAIELNKENLKNIQNEINQIKMDNPDNEDIQSGFSDISGPSDIPDDFPQDEGGITKIIIGAGKEEASSQVKNVLDSIDKTGYITSQMSAEDIKNLGEKLINRDVDGFTSKIYDEIDEAQSFAPKIVLNEISKGLGVDLIHNPVSAAIATGNMGNAVIQKVAENTDLLSGMDFGDNLLANTAEKGLDFTNYLVQPAATLSSGIMTDANKMQKNFKNLLFNNPWAAKFGHIAGLPFDSLYNIDYSDIPFITRKKKDPVIEPPVVIPPEVVSNVVTGGTGGDGWTPPATTNEAEVDYGGTGGGTGGSYGGGEDFGSPFAPSPPPRGPNLTNRADGGIIQKYNHGGLHKNPHTDDIDLSGILNPSIPDEIKDELMKYLLNKYMQEQELMKERRKDQYNQPPPTMLEAADGGLATIPRYLKGR